MTKEIVSSNFNISGIQGDVWLHHEHMEKLESGKDYMISFGDALITAPMAKVIVEIPSMHPIQIGGSHKEVFVFDQTVQDHIQDITEVAIDASSRTTLMSSTFAETINPDTHEYLNFLINQDEFGLYTSDPDLLLSFSSMNQEDTYTSSTVELRDVISDFNPSNDCFILPHPGSIAKGFNTFTEAQNKITLNHSDIALHKIDDHGYVSFKDSQGRDISLTDPAMLNPVVQYLAQNLNGSVGDTVMFKIAADSYIYHFHPEAYPQQYNITKFEGLAFDGLIASNEIGAGNYLYIDFS